MRRLVTLGVLAVALSSLAAVPSSGEGTDADILYRYDAKALKLGKFGSFAKFQTALFNKLEACGAARQKGYGEADGIFGRDTKQAVIDIQRCYPFGPALAGGPAANGSAVTTGLWEILMGAVEPPSAGDRVSALTLHLEGTDYDALQFNFCQSRNPKTKKTYLGGDKDCYSNDRSSFITWGPRGATAGHGGEVQQVLSLAENEDAAILDNAFSGEAPTMRRLINADAQSLAVILCAAWIDPVRRSSIEDGFRLFGQGGNVQKLYGQVYDSRDADGAKIERFYRIYKMVEPLIGRAPTEIDHAFFLDRATHGGAPPEDIKALAGKFTLALGSEKRTLTPALVRQILAGLLPVANGDQRTDRLGRDMIYLLDDPSLTFTATARAALASRSGLRASNFGLSDARIMPDYKPSPATGFSERKRQNNATEAERLKCPAIVLSPKSPKNG